jgi:hypothetical protein
VIAEGRFPTAVIATNARVKASYPESIYLFDFDVLSSLVSDDEELADKFAEINQEALVFGRVAAQRLPLLPHIAQNRPGGDAHRRAARFPERGKGEQLWREIDRIRPGKGRDALQFAKKCSEAFKYICEHDLTAWHEELGTHSRIHRYDLIARIASQHDFWHALVRDHRTRYVVFEFKNYKAKITQQEIYTTEKYLYPAAMRSTAIIVTRVGANENAIAVTRGALRETGKLILILNLNDIHQMLQLRDAAGDCLSTLVQKLDEILMKIDR